MPEPTRIFELQQQRAATEAALRSYLDGLSAEGAHPDADKVQELRDSVTAARAAQEAAELLEAGGDPSPVADGRDDVQRALDNYDVQAVIRSFMPNDQGGDVDVGAEMELSQEIATKRGKKPQGVFVPDEVLFRAQTPTTTATAAGVVGERIRVDLAARTLRPAKIMARLGAMFIGGLTDKLTLPRVTDGAAIEWITAAGGLSDASAFDTEGVSGEPHTAACHKLIDRKLLVQPSADVRGLITDDLRMAVEQGIDAAAMTGSGANGQPQGILGLTGLPTTAVAAGTGDAVNTTEGRDLFIDAAAAVFKTNAIDDFGQLGAVIGPDVWAVLAKIKAEGEYRNDWELLATIDRLRALVIWQGMPVAGNPLRQQALIGDFSNLLICTWSGLDLLVNPYAPEAYKRGGVFVRVMMDVDVIVRRKEAFRLLTGLELS